MPEYLIFFGRRGAAELVWRPEENPVGVYDGATPTEAVQKASAHKGIMGAFFCVEGTFHGFDMNNTPTSYGSKVTTDQKVGKLIDQISALTGLEPGQVRELTEGGGGE